QRDSVRAVRLSESAQIADILAHRQAGIYVQIVYWIDRRVLSAELRRARLERLRVIRRPPVAKISRPVGFSPLIVEAMTDFVADDRSNCAVVHSVIGINVEERRL